MLSFNCLGNLGRLGNQMFQYAALKGISKKNQYEFIIPPKKVFGNNDFNVRRSDRSIYDCFNLTTSNTGISNYPQLVESTFAFDENLYHGCPDNIDLFGYFQSEKYFKDIEEDIRKDFTFKEDILEVSKKVFSSLFSEKEVVSLHIRRGDYLTNPNHPVQTLEYYENALSYFDKNLPVIVFSDDSKWCENQKIFDPDRFFISHGGDTGVDLCLMSMCTYHIIANSSFSWWGSYLAESKKTIAPINWFGAELKKTKDIKDLYLNDWIVI